MVTYRGRMSKDEDRVFKALGDPTRRFLLDLLFRVNMFAALAVDDRGPPTSTCQGAVVRRKGRPTDLATYSENLHVMLCLIEAYVERPAPTTFAHQRSAVEAARRPRRCRRQAVPSRGRPDVGCRDPAPTARTSTYLGELSAQALELDHRFGFSWLATLADCIHDWAEALSGRGSEDTIQTLQRRLDQMLAAGRNGSHSTMLLLLGEHPRGTRSIRTWPARRSFVHARGPGPYRGLVVDLVDRRLNALPARRARSTDVPVLPVGPSDQDIGRHR